MFEKGRKKLYAELDLIRLIKQLRVAAFMSQVYLKPYQNLTVDWLADYRLSTDEDESSGEEGSDYVAKTFSKEDFSI